MAASAYTLSTLRDIVEATLIDSSNISWATADLDAAIRLALDEISKVNGSALALKHIGSKRMPVAVCGDGDYLMGVTALWTAVHYRIPMLFVIANNISYNNYVEHQERVALMRDRPVENKWIGQFMNDPECDLMKMAEGQGAKAFGQAKTLEEMEAMIAEAVKVVEAGGVALVDVRIEQVSRVDAAAIKQQSDR